MYLSVYVIIISNYMNITRCMYISDFHSINNFVIIIIIIISIYITCVQLKYLYNDLTLKYYFIVKQADEREKQNEVCLCFN